MVQSLATIGGVEFIATRFEARGRHHWRAKVRATGQTFPQSYPTRESMWRDLETIARIRPHTFAMESLAYAETQAAQ